MAKIKKNDELEQQIAELTLDLQRTRADFENFRKRADIDKTNARHAGKVSAIMQLLPVVDNIERAISHLPDNLRQDTWAMGVANLAKNLDKSLENLGLARIDAKPGTIFNPESHAAVQFDDESDGEHEVISEELQPGYTLDGQVVRHSMVKVIKQ